MCHEYAPKEQAAATNSEFAQFCRQLTQNVRKGGEPRTYDSKQINYQLQLHLALAQNRN